MAGSKDTIRPILLIGMPGSGKSTIAPLLAQELGWEYFDLDQEIEKKTGLSINQLFKEQGEQKFRELEKECLMAQLIKSKCVIATGGGTPVYADNMERMLSVGNVIFLSASLPELCKRLESQAGKRPLLANSDWKTKLMDLIEQRLPYYKRATVHIVTDNKLPADLVKEILKGEPTY